MNDYQTIVGIVGSAGQAESAIIALQSAGFSRGDISALFPDRRETEETGGAVPELGRVLGGTIGLLAGIGALILPVGPFIAAGPLMVALRGASAGAAVGTIAGVLAGLGIPLGEAVTYENEVREGRILLAVKVHNAEGRERAREILERAEAHEIGTMTGSPLRPSPGLHSLR